jgi:hypothetical protein
VTEGEHSEVVPLFTQCQSGQCRQENSYAGQITVWEVANRRGQ